SDELDQRFSDGSDFFSELTFELLGCRAQGQISAGANQIDDRFRLGQVHLAVQERALGKFSGPRSARSCAQTRLQNFRGNENPSMTANFDEMLSGITRGC